MAPSTGEKCRYESPTEEDQRNEEALDAELARQTRALSLSHAGRVATIVPRLGTNLRKLKIRDLDQTASLLRLADHDTDADSNFGRLCALIDGSSVDGDMDGHIDQCSTKSICEALILAYQEMNCILCDSIDALVEEAIELGVDVDMAAFDQNRNHAFIEEQEAAYMSNLVRIEKDKAVTRVKESRCEIAWMKDNRDRLVDYVEEAKSIRDACGSHEFRFEFYSRDTDIELLENEDREDARHGQNATTTARNIANQHGAMSPAERKRPVSISTEE